MMRLAHELRPDGVQTSTPLRRCSVKPLSPGELGVVEFHFHGLNTVPVYKSKKLRVLVENTRAVTQGGPTL